MIKSCLVAKLSHYLTLSPREKSFLEEMEGPRERHSRGSTVVDRGAETRNIFVVKSGWLISSSADSEGTEIVTEIFHPGDVVGVSQLGLERSTYLTAAATPVELCPFPKRSLPDVFCHYPRLTALFFTFVTLERTTLLDRLRATGRMSARDCVALFLLQTRARLRVTGAVQGDRFELPLSQELIGNVVGLSTVSVNRALRLLENEGYIAREGRSFTLCCPAKLAGEIDFVDYHYRIDTSWLPLEARHADLASTR